METKDRHPLASLGCSSDAHALLVLPRGYIDSRFHHRTLASLPVGRRVLVAASLVSWEALDRDGQPTRSPFPAQLGMAVTLDCGKAFTMRAFSEIQEWLEVLRERPREITFLATLEQHPRFGPSLTQVAMGQCTNSVQAHYAGKSGAAGEVIQSYIAGLRGNLDCIQEATRLMLEQRGVVGALAQHGYTNAKRFLRDLHFPPEPDDGYRALGAARAAAIAEVRHLLPTPNGRPALDYDLDAQLIPAVAAQPEKLSQDQRLALNRIRRELQAGQGARILLNGDVGTGKTLVFMLAAGAVARASQRAVAVMAPSELVARQIHAQALTRFPDLDPKLVVGGSGDSGTSRMYVGTQALLSRELPDLVLLVIDEQHKFSVPQRLALANDATHIIEASATPIPRSLAISIFGGWVNVKIEKPPVQKLIRSAWLSDEDRPRINDIVKAHLREGRKVMFLYPTVKGNGLLSAAERLAAIFPDKVVALHGKSSDKSAALASFKSGERPIAIVSTVVEVGVDVPDVGCMVVNGAERFGIAQLHQLRGRLMRAGGQGDFILFTDKRKMPRSTQRRLESICQIADGFALAEADLSIRGFGELLGECQAGGATQLFKQTDLKPEDFL